MSDFIAAMLTHRLSIDEELLRSSFTKLDVDHSGSVCAVENKDFFKGFISFDNLREVLGDDYSIKTLAHIFAEADSEGKGMIGKSPQEFFRLMVGNDESSTPAAGVVADAGATPQLAVSTTT